VDAITVVRPATEELLQVLLLQFMEGSAPKMLVALASTTITTGSSDGGNLSACVHEVPRDVLIAAKKSALFPLRMGLSEQSCSLSPARSRAPALSHPLR